MENTYSSREILTIAVKIEKNGHDFYLKLSKESKDDKLKTLFTELAKMETEHVNLFSEMLQNVPDDDFETLSSFGFSEEIFLYLEAIADSKIFVKNNNFSLDTQQDIMNVFAIALALEKDSIIFYYELLAYMSEQHKKTIETILTEEKKHILLLVKKRKEFSNT